MRKNYKICAAAVVLTACGPSAMEIRQMGEWSRKARTECRTLGSCPAERACIAAVRASVAKGAGRTEYAAARSACAAYKVQP